MSSARFRARATSVPAGAPSGAAAPLRRGGATECAAARTAAFRAALLLLFVLAASSAALPPLATPAFADSASVKVVDGYWGSCEDAAAFDSALSDRAESLGMEAVAAYRLSVLDPDGDAVYEEFGDAVLSIAVPAEQQGATLRLLWLLPEGTVGYAGGLRSVSGYASATVSRYAASKAASDGGSAAGNVLLVVEKDSLSTLKDSYSDLIDEAFGGYREADYTAKGWKSLEAARDDGKAAVQKAASESAATSAYRAALSAMAAVEKDDSADVDRARAEGLVTLARAYASLDRSKYADAGWKKVEDAFAKAKKAVESAASVAAAAKAASDGVKALNAVKADAKPSDSSSSSSSSSGSSKSSSSSSSSSGSSSSSKSSSSSSSSSGSSSSSKSSSSSSSASSSSSSSSGPSSSSSSSSTGLSGSSSDSSSSSSSPGSSGSSGLSTGSGASGLSSGGGLSSGSGASRLSGGGLPTGSPAGGPSASATAAEKLGVQLTDVTNDLMEQKGLMSDIGVLVTGVNAGGPADKAGIKADWVIVKAAGKTVSSVGELNEALKDLADGDAVELVVEHDNKSEARTVTLGSGSGAPAGAAAQPDALDAKGGGADGTAGSGGGQPDEAAPADGEPDGDAGEPSSLEATQANPVPFALAGLAVLAAIGAGAWHLMTRRNRGLVDGEDADFDTGPAEAEGAAAQSRADLGSSPAIEF